jgi:hypothetical protein
MTSRMYTVVPESDLVDMRVFAGMQNDVDQFISRYADLDRSHTPLQRYPHPDHGGIEIPRFIDSWHTTAKLPAPIPIRPKSYTL